MQCSHMQRGYPSPLKGKSRGKGKGKGKGADVDGGGDTGEVLLLELVHRLQLSLWSVCFDFFRDSKVVVHLAIISIALFAQTHSISSFHFDYVVLWNILILVRFFVCFVP